MENHNLLSDLEFVDQFEQKELNLKLLNHDAQIRLVWIYFNKVGRKSTTSLILSRIGNCLEKEMDKYTFDKNLAKQTIRVLTIYMKRSGSNSFEGFMQKFPDIKNDTIKLFQERTDGC